MYYTHPVSTRRLVRAVLLPAAAMFLVGAAAAQPLPPALASLAPFIANHQTHRERLDVGDRSIDVTLIVAAGKDAGETAALLDATRAGLLQLGAWIGPLPTPTLSVIDAPWHLGVAGASYPSIVVTSSRWLSTSRDPAAERRLLAALARQYTLTITATGDADAAFAEGLALYLGRRLIHHRLHGRNFETPRFFGGFIPFSLWPVLNSIGPEDPRPPLQHVADVEEPSEARWRVASAAPGSPAQRVAAALQSFERLVGWPALQQVLEEFVRRIRGRAATRADFAALAVELTGHDVFAALAGDTRESTLDYAITSFRSAATERGFLTTVTVRRNGASAGFDIPLLVRFADGAEVTERVKASEVEQSFVYHSPVRAVLASVDPAAVLVIDSDRRNNTRAVCRPVNLLGLRLALNWMIWLQDTMLAYTATL